MKLDTKNLKIKVKLATLLTFVFFAVLIIELWIVYTSVYLSLRSNSEVELVPTPAIRINLAGYKNFEVWLTDKQEYQIAPYAFESSAGGRENPFAEYPR